MASGKGEQKKGRVLAVRAKGQERREREREAQHQEAKETQNVSCEGQRAGEGAGGAWKKSPAIGG